MNMTPKISIIIPVYNVEKYIERCARSLFEQTLDNIEYIFVNDCSPDESITVLRQTIEEYPNRKLYIKIIDMPVNSKQAKARSFGLKVATGEYVIHCDPDDWVDLNYYEALYKEAKTNDLDVISGNYMVHWPNKITAPISICLSTYLSVARPIEILQYDNYIILSLSMFMVKRNVIIENKIDFFDGVDFSEDFGFLARVLYFAKSYRFVQTVFYHYEKENDGAITRRKKSLRIIAQRIKCLQLVDKFYEERGISRNTLTLSMRTKREIKDMFMLSRTLNKWRMLFPEVAYWQYHCKNVSFLYRLIYLLSHQIGVWPMYMYLLLNKIVK